MMSPNRHPDIMRVLASNAGVLDAAVNDVIAMDTYGVLSMKLPKILAKADRQKQSIRDSTIVPGDLDMASAVAFALSCNKPSSLRKVDPVVQAVIETVAQLGADVIPARRSAPPPKGLEECVSKACWSELQLAEFGSRVS